MSTTNTETIIDKTLKTVEKGSPCKNGFLKENNSKEYIIEIVKEVIKEDLPEDDEDEKASTNLVVGKVVEIKDDGDIKSGNNEPASVLLINGCFSDKDSGVQERNIERDKNVSHSNEISEFITFDKTDKNILSKHNCLRDDTSSCGESSIFNSITDNSVNSSASTVSINSVGDISVNVESNKDCVNNSHKKESLDNQLSKTERLVNTTFSDKDSSNDLLPSGTVNSQLHPVNKNLENSESTKNKLVKKESEDLLQKEETSAISEELKEVSSKEEDKKCKDTSGLIPSEVEAVSSSNKTANTETIKSDKESSEDVILKQQNENDSSNADISKKQLSEINNSSMDIGLSKSEKNRPDLPFTNSESDDKCKSENSGETFLSRNKPIQDISNSIEKVDSLVTSENKTCSSNEENKPCCSLMEASTSLEVEKKEDGIVCETECVASTDIKKSTDCESICKNPEKLNDDLVPEDVSHSPVADKEKIPENNGLPKTRESAEVSSSKSDENLNKSDKSVLKRPPTPDLEIDETPKKIRVLDNEQNSKKRNSEENSLDFKKENKKLRLSEKKTTSSEVENEIIIDGIVDVSKEESEIELNKENNKDNNLVKNIDDNKKIKLDKNEKVKEGKKVNKDKLKRKESKKWKDKREKDSSKEIKSVNLGSVIENNREKSNESKEASENENTKQSKLDLLGKKINSVEENETELLNSNGHTCPLCSCGCKFKKNDREVFGEKTRTFMDVLADNSENMNININLVQKLEELVGQTVADWATNKCDVGIVRKRAHFLEEEHDRLIQLTINLKKQLDDARCIMKRMIDEKIAQKSWGEGIIPLKVTRSVGLQVCTTGSAHVLIKAPEIEKESFQTRINASTTANTIAITSDTRTNATSTDISKINNGAIGNSVSKDLHQKETSRIESINSNGRTTTASIIASNQKEGASVGEAKQTSHSGSTNLGVETTSSDVEDDPEVQVIEAAAAAVILPNQHNLSSSSQSVVNTPKTSANTTPTLTTSPTTPQITPAIYVLKPSDVMGGAARNVRQVTPTSKGGASSSEVIDLTDNDPVAWSTPKTTNTANNTAANRLGGGPTSARLPTSQTAAKSNSFNFNVASSTVPGVNKVVTFPADSTTAFVIQRPNNQANTIRKAVTQPSPSSGTEMLLTSLSALPPLPRAIKYAPNIAKPPKPILRICKNSSGIMLSWNFDEHIPTTIRKYQVYAYQEGTPIDVSKSDMWKKVGDVDALPLPMACTLTQFKEGHKYFFVVRAMDVNMRLGEFSLPGSIMLTNTSPLTNTPTRV